MALLIFLNGGYLFCCIPFQPNTPAVAAGSTPFVFMISLLSVQEFAEVWNQHRAMDDGRRLRDGRGGLRDRRGRVDRLAVRLLRRRSSTAPTAFGRHRTPAQQLEYLRGLAKKEAHPDEVP